jgi:hypothetical protein
LSSAACSPSAGGYTPQGRYLFGPHGPESLGLQSWAQVSSCWWSVPSSVTMRNGLGRVDGNSQAGSTAFHCLRRGLRLKDGPGSARAATVIVWLRWEFILSPSARTTGPSRRREDEPPREGWRVCADAGDVERQGDEHLESGPGGGSRPRAPRVWLRSPRFFTPYRPTRTRHGLPCTSAGETPHPMVGRAISVPLALVMGGLSRSVTEPFQCRPGRYEARTVRIPKLTVRVRFPSLAPSLARSVRARPCKTRQP